MTLIHRPPTHRVRHAFLVVPVLVVAASAALASPQSVAPPTESAQALKVAVTAEDHLSKAAEYRKKAASYREEAAMHRKMYADYKKTVAINMKAPENRWLRKMQDHCDRYIKDAETLAADAEKFAEFHSLRAAELQGK
jgi:hypothetical protein